MRTGRTPEMNDFGLVLPPSPDSFDYVELWKPVKKPQTVARHHLYWPRHVYNKSPLSAEFREHRFSSVWLMHNDHVALHRQFDGVPVPSPDVMVAYLEEANLLEQLNVCVKAVELIDVAIYTGRVCQMEAAEENRSKRLDLIHRTLERAASFEVVPSEVARLAIEQALPLAAAA